MDTELNPSRIIEGQPNQNFPPIETEVFIPSRKRELKEMQERAACFDQPTGHALPTLLPSKATMHSHLDAALSINPQAFYLGRLITPQIRNITQQLKEEPETAIRQRPEALRHLEMLSTNLDQIRGKWRANLPKDSPSNDVNFPLLRLILNSLDYDDKSLTVDISRGLPIAVVIPRTNALKQKFTPRTISIEKWMSNVESRNKTVLKYLLGPRDFQLSVQCWENRWAN